MIDCSGNLGHNSYGKGEVQDVQTLIDCVRIPAILEQLRNVRDVIKKQQGSLSISLNMVCEYICILIKILSNICIIIVSLQYFITLKIIKIDVLDKLLNTIQVAIPNL